MADKRKQRLLPEDYIHIPSTFWSVAVGRRYDRVLKILLHGGIIQNTTYSWKDGICRAFRIAPALMEGSVSKIVFEGGRQKSSSLPECRSTVRFMRLLKPDIRKAKKLITHYIQSKEYQRDITINPNLPDSQPIRVHPHNTPFAEPKIYSIRFWRNIALAQGMSIIRDKTDYYIDYPERYFSKKELNIRISYYDAIYRFQNREFTASRNATNERLDSNLSSFPSLLLGCLRYDEPLVSIDLSNSQFVMFSKIIESGFLHHIFNISQLPAINNNNHIVSGDNIRSYNTTRNDTELVVNERQDPILTGDVIEFIEVAKSGQLYEKIQKHFELPDGDAGRKEAKGLMFQVCFSARRDNRAFKKKLKELYPNVISIMDRVKARYRDNDFAILLQKMESNIFIDKIKKELDHRGLLTATKHDSVICPLSQLPQVKKIVREILDKELGEYQLKTEPLEPNDTRLNKLGM